MSSLAVLLALATASGCAAPRVKLSELPPYPIAITYWEPEAARRRAEIIIEAPERAGPRREGVARLEHLGAILGVYDPRREAPSLSQFPGHLALLDPRTGEVERIQAATAGSRPLAWSSDHKRLLFASSPKLGAFQLYEYDVEDEFVRRLTSGERSSLTGAYGPDRRLAYASLVPAQGGMNIYVTGPHGASPQLLSRGVATDAIAWSPKGNPLVYVRRDAGRSRRGNDRPMMVALEPSGDSAERELGPGRDPVFTPDGEWIVYSGPVGDSWKLRRMRPDGSGRTRVGFGSNEEVQPAVSPDNGFVAYIGRDKSEIDRLYVRRMDGTGTRRLINTGGAASPRW